MEVEEAAAVAVPLQVLLLPGVAETVSPVGSVMLKATPVSVTAFAAGFVSVKVSTLVPLTAIGDVAKAAAIVGGAMTPIVVEAATPVPPLVDVGAFVETV